MRLIRRISMFVNVPLLDSFELGNPFGVARLWVEVTSCVETIRTSSTDLTIHSGSIVVYRYIIHGE